MKDINIKVKIEAKEDSIQQVKDTLKLASYITEEVVVDASITSEDKEREDVVYEVEVVTLHFKDGTLLKIDEEGEFVITTDDSKAPPILKGRVPSELFPQFRDVALSFMDLEEEIRTEFANRVNVSVEERRVEK